jgi:hypothetical protein
MKTTKEKLMPWIFIAIATTAFLIILLASL